MVAQPSQPQYMTVDEWREMEQQRVLGSHAPRRPSILLCHNPR